MVSSSYSDRAQRLAYELSVKATSNLVERYGYTVWCDVKTHKIEYLRPRVPVDNWNTPGYRRPGTAESNPKRIPDWVMGLSILIFLGGLALIFIPR